MRYAITITKGPDAGRTFFLEQPETLLGRDPGAGGLRLADSSISRKHIRLLHGDRGLELEDLGSRNGTLVNGSHVTRCRLEEGDTVVVGDTSIRVHLKAPTLPGIAAAKPFDHKATLNPLSLQTEIMARQDRLQDMPQLRRARNALAAVCRTGNILSAIPDMNELFRRLPDLILDELDHADRCFMLWPNTHGELVCQTSSSRLEGPQEGGSGYSRSLLDIVKEDRNAVLFQDILGDSRFQSSESVRIKNIRMAMAAPIASDQDPPGVLYVDSVSTDKGFEEEDLRLLTLLALQAESALKNARLYQRLQQEKTEVIRANKELLKTQHQLLQSEKMASIGQLAAGVVHDIKTPLTVILGHAQLLRLEMEKSEDKTLRHDQVVEPLRMIEEGIDYCNRIGNQLLQYARQVEPQKRLLDFNALVQSTLEFLQASFTRVGMTLELHLAHGVPAVNADGNQLKQVFINIAMNAMQAMQKGGQLTVRTAADADKSGAPGVRVDFTDTGVGMTEAQQRCIFDPFFTTKKADHQGGGIGLGLAVTHGIVTTHGGTIAVRSRPGEGATFTLRFPVDAP